MGRWGGTRRNGGRGSCSQDILYERRIIFFKNWNKIGRGRGDKNVCHYAIKYFYVVDTEGKTYFRKIHLNIQ